MQPARKNTLTFGVVNAPVGVAKAAMAERGGDLKMCAPFERDAKGELPARARKVSQVYIDPLDVAEVPAKALGREGKERVKVLPFDRVWGKAELEGFRAVERGKDAQTGETVYQPIDVEAFYEAANRLESMEVLGFVPATALADYVDRVYDCHYLQPQEATPAKPLGLLARAMKLEKVSAVVKFAVGSREREGVVRVRPDGALEVLSLAFADRWKEPDDAVLSVTQVEVSRRELDLARDLVRAMTVDASLLDDLRDESGEKQAELIGQVLAGEVPADDRPSAPVADLMELLAASVEATKKGKGRKAVAA